MEEPVHKTWEVPNRLPALAAAAREVFNWLANMPISSRAKYSAGLVVEEVVTNAIKYGYDGDPAEHVIRFTITVFPDYLRIVFEDDAAPFDPTQYPAPDVDKLVDSNRVGGLGIELVRRVCARMAYKRDGDINRLTLHIRRLEPGDTQLIRLNL